MLGAGPPTSGAEASSSSTTGSPEQALDVPPAEAWRCGALDVLFVVDNSGSMRDRQDRLAAAAPGFVAALRDVGLGVERGIRAGVVTTDGYRGNAVRGCDRLGALVTHVASSGTAQPTSCGVEPGPWSEDSAFVGLACALVPGDFGAGQERVVDAMLAAVDPWMSQEGQCNEGWLRLGWTDGDRGEDQASLLVVVITDEDDTASEGDPEEWAEHLAYFRSGLDDVTVVMLLGEATYACEDEHPERLLELAALLPHVAVGSSCADDYVAFLRDAVGVVAGSCGVDPPPEP